MNTRLTHWLGVLIAIAIAAPGCSSSEEEGGGDDAAQTAEMNEATTPPPATPAPVEPQELSASHILIAYQGAMRADGSITRTQDEALERAEMVADLCKKEGADFGALAAEYSDGPSGPNGGKLGVFHPQQMVQPFSEACAALQVGQVSEPVETQFGYHIIRRDVIEKAGARHILVMHNESQRKPPNVNRTKEEALERIQMVLEKARAGESFEVLAGEYSDGPSNVTGGDLGVFARGQMVPEFDSTVFSMEIGDISDVVETPFGYHIIYRYQ